MGCLFNSKALALFIRGLLIIYRYLISPVLGHHCRFYPSCSVYAQQAFTLYPLLKAGRLVFMRLMKCHPFHPGGYDPIK